MSHDESSAAKMEWDRATSTQASVSSSRRKARVGCDAHGFQCTKIGAKGQAATNRKSRTVHTLFWGVVARTGSRICRYEFMKKRRFGNGWGEVGRRCTTAGGERKGCTHSLYLS